MDSSPILTRFFLVYGPISWHEGVIGFALSSFSSELLTQRPRVCDIYKDLCFWMKIFFLFLSYSLYWHSSEKDLYFLMC